MWVAALIRPSATHIGTVGCDFQKRRGTLLLALRRHKDARTRPVGAGKRSSHSKLTWNLRRISAVYLRHLRSQHPPRSSFASTVSCKRARSRRCSRLAATRRRCKPQNRPFVEMASKLGVMPTQMRSTPVPPGTPTAQLAPGSIGANAA